jgi:phosphatidylinositol alpha-1,6-mannosyltransferase
MRILLLTSEFPPFNGGIATYARELAAAAMSAGHDVTVLAPDYGTNQAAGDAGLPGRVLRFAGAAADAKGLPARIRATRRLLATERFDIVHAVDWPFFIPVALAPRRAARVLLTVHGSEIIYMQATKRRLLLALVGFWRRGWAQWIGNSRYTVELLLNAFPAIRKADTRAVPLAVGEEWHMRRVPRTAARASFGLAEGDLVVASLGRVVPRKGHLDLAAALMLIPDELAARVHWWVIGPLNEPNHADRVRAAAAALPVRAKLFGGLPAEEVSARLCAVDLFCLPGYQDEGGRVEGFGLVFLEAGAFGVPSVATCSGGIPEAVPDGTGLLVSERDPVALADAITRVLGDDALRARLAEAAEAHAAQATWEKVMLDTYGAA